MKADEILNRRKVNGPPTLTGKDIDKATLKVKIAQVEESPAEWNSPLLLTFTPTIKSIDKARGEINKMGLNRTNAKTLMTMYGPETGKWIGETLVLARVKVNNPQTGKDDWGLRILE